MHALTPTSGRQHTNRRGCRAFSTFVRAPLRSQRRPSGAAPHRRRARRPGKGAAWPKRTIYYLYDRPRCAPISAAARTRAPPAGPFSLHPAGRGRTQIRPQRPRARAERPADGCAARPRCRHGSRSRVGGAGRPLASARVLRGTVQCRSTPSGGGGTGPVGGGTGGGGGTGQPSCHPSPSLLLPHPPFCHCAPSLLTLPRALTLPSSRLPNMAPA